MRARAHFDPIYLEARGTDVRAAHARMDDVNLVYVFARFSIFSPSLTGAH